MEGRRNGLDGIQVKMLFGDFCDCFNGISGPIMFRGGYQSQVAFGEMLLVEFGYGAKHRNTTVVFNAVP